MKTTKKQKKSNLKVSLLLLLLAAVLLISSTYAWFVSQNTAEVSTLQVKIETVEGIQISSNAKNWTSTLTNAMITGADYVGSELNYKDAVNQVPSILKPVSTIGEIDKGKQKMFLGKVLTSKTDANDGKYILTATPETDTHGLTGNYITFDFFINLESTSAKDLYLQPGSGVVWNGERAAADTNAAYKNDKGLQNAARIAFIVEGNVDTSQTEDASTAVQNKIYNQADADCGKYLWEPNSNTHTTNAKNQALDGRDTPKYTAEEQAANPVPYSGVKTAIEEKDDMLLANANVAGNTSFFAAMTPTLFTDTGFTQRQKLMTIKPGYTKVRAYMWIEGQDMDCYTGASGTYLDFNLKFEVDTVTGA